MRWTFLLLLSVAAPVFSQAAVHEKLRAAVDHGVELETALVAVQRARLDLDRALALSLPTLTVAAPEAVQTTIDPNKFDLGDVTLSGSGQLGLSTRLPGGTTADVGAGLDWSRDPKTLTTIPTLSFRVNQRFDLEPGPKNVQTGQELARLNLAIAENLLAEERSRTAKRVVQRLVALETARADGDADLVAYQAAQAQQEAVAAWKRQGRASAGDLWKADAEVRRSTSRWERSRMGLAQAQADWRRETGLETWSPTEDERGEIEAALAAWERDARLAQSALLSLQTQVRWWTVHQDGELRFPSASFATTAKKPADEPWQVTLSLGINLSSDAWVWLAGQDERRRWEKLDQEQQARAQERAQADALQAAGQRRDRALKDLQDALLERDLARSQQDEAEVLATQGGLTQAELLGQRAIRARAEAAVVAAQWAVVTSGVSP